MRATQAVAPTKVAHRDRGVSCSRWTRCPIHPTPVQVRPVDIVWKILATLGLVALNGYFVAAEFAAVGARLSRLETEAERIILASLALRIKRQLDLYLSTCQLGITIASLALGAVTEPLVAAMVDPILHRLGIPAPS